MRERVILREFVNFMYIHTYCVIYTLRMHVIIYMCTYVVCLHILTSLHTKVHDSLFLCSEREEQTLQNISFECDTANRMLAIVGPVGAGKVSLSSNWNVIY